MGFVTATKSVFSAIADALRSKHDWQYDDVHELRVCTCCGRQEELILDLVSTNWEMREPGDENAHAAKTHGVRPRPPADSSLVPVCMSKTSH